MFLCLVCDLCCCTASNQLGGSITEGKWWNTQSYSIHSSIIIVFALGFGYLQAIERAQGSSEEVNATRKEDTVSESSGDSEPQLVFSETSIDDDATENTVTQGKPHLFLL